MSYLNLLNRIKQFFHGSSDRSGMSSPKQNLIVFQRHDSYQDYLSKQKEKTLDPARIKRWYGAEWDKKYSGFIVIFERIFDYLKPATSCICLGARTGQEVAALRALGKQAIGVDLVAFPPYTVEGDIHSLPFSNDSFDFVFTNIFDHSPDPHKFISEIERICKSNGHIVIHLELGEQKDPYSENSVFDPRAVLRIFKNSDTLSSSPIENSFDKMNYELIMRKK